MKTGALLRLCAALVVVCGLGAQAQTVDAGVEAKSAGGLERTSDLGLPFTERLTGRALDELPTVSSTHQVLGGYFLSALFSNEENFGYSDIEHARLTMIGNSAQWTQWRLESLQLTDPLFDGAEAFHVPWAMLSGIELVHAESARESSSGGGPRLLVAPARGRPTASASVDVAAGGLGGVFPPAEAIVQFFDGTPAVPPPPPVAERPRLLGRVQVHSFATEQLGALMVRAAVDAHREDRRHLSFFGFGDSASGVAYDEPGTRASFMAELAPAHRRWKAYVLSEYLERENLFAEQGFSRSETQALRSGGVMLGLLTDAPWGSAHLGATWKRYVTRAQTPGFARELNDADGEGLFPFIPDGTMDAFRLEGRATHRQFYANSDMRVLNWAPSSDSARGVTHALSWSGAPLGTMSSSSQPTTTLIGDQRVGWATKTTFGIVETAFTGSLVLSHAQARQLSMVLPAVGLKADVVVNLAASFQPFFSLGYTPIPLTSQLALLMTPGYFRGEEAGPQGTVRVSGGQFVRPGPDLRSAGSFAVATGFRSRFLGAWTASLQAIGKVWDAPLELALDGDPGAFGHFSDGVFFFDRPDTRYVLVNTPFSRTPFGGMVQLQVARVDDGVGYFTLSFSGMAFVGSPPLGNGAWANDVGVVDWSSAHPNSARFAFSSLDGDRGYAFRMSGGRRWWRGLWTSFFVAYRDGQPFAWLDSASENGQLARWGARSRGSPLKGTRPLLGWRETFQCVIDLQVSYELQLSTSWALRVKVVVANAFDLNNETVERMNSETGTRSALATQLPRSGSIGFELFQGSVDRSN